MNYPSHELRETLSIIDQLKQGQEIGLVEEFDEDLWEKISQINIFGFCRDFLQIFEIGLNIGHCGSTARYLSFIFDNFKIVEGRCDFLKGTEGSPNGEHAWLEVDDYVYDTTLLFKINKEYAYSVVGYSPIMVTDSDELKKDDIYFIQKQSASDRAMIEYKKQLLKRMDEILSE